MSLRRRIRVVLEVGYALWWMVRIEVSLRRRDLATTCRRLGIAHDLDSAAPPATEQAVLPRRTKPAVSASRFMVASWPAGNTCLRRCLLIGHRLRDLSPVLRIGVRRDDAGFLAHSWLEIDGRTLDPSAADFATLGRS
ncbi:MAG: lasso peptide biosynthesis B2 protein [Actinophytocola sp.]|nr:lasso peptide biosynthesis B2 protein [Actinophytocola sp.]